MHYAATFEQHGLIQRIDHPEVAHVFAIQRFYANDANDDVGGHAILLLGFGQAVDIGAPKGDTGVNTVGFNKPLTVGAPIFGHAHRWWQHQHHHR